MAVDADRARRALALVESDPDARADLLAAWTSGEDPIAALREAADPGVPGPSSRQRAERLSRNERLAFGRSDDPDAAEAARRAIEADSAAATAVAAAVRAGIGAVERGARRRSGEDAPGAAVDELAPESGRVDDPDTGDAEPSPRPTRRIGGRLFAAGVAAALAVGIGAGVGIGAIARPGARPVATPTATPSPAADEPLSMIVRVFPTKVVNSWFSQGSTANDVLPDAAAKTPNLAGATARFVASTPDGSIVFVARTPKGGYCVAVDRTKAPASTISTCATKSEFAQGDSVEINVADATAIWDRAELHIAIPQH